MSTSAGKKLYIVVGKKFGYEVKTLDEIGDTSEYIHGFIPSKPVTGEKDSWYIFKTKGYEMIVAKRWDDFSPSDTLESITCISLDSLTGEAADQRGAGGLRDIYVLRNP